MLDHQTSNFSEWIVKSMSPAVIKKKKKKTWCNKIEITSRPAGAVIISRAQVIRAVRLRSLDTVFPQVFTH